MKTAAGELAVIRQSIYDELRDVDANTRKDLLRTDLEALLVKHGVKIVVQHWHDEYGSGSEVYFTGVGEFPTYKLFPKQERVMRNRGMGQ